MEGELLCLKWRDHCSSLFRTLSSVRKKEVYCDATIACDGRFYPVHKIVLSTCSDYFEQMFEMAEQKNLMIVLTDIGYEELETLLDYMYFGEVNVLQSDLNGFMKAAERLRIKGLAEPSEPDQTGEYSEKRTKSQEDNRDAKRKKCSNEALLHADRSQNVTDMNLNRQGGPNEVAKESLSTKEYVQFRKEVPVTTSLEPTRLEADVSLHENGRDSLAIAHNTEIKLEPYIKVEPVDWRQTQICEDSVFTSTDPSVGYLPPTSGMDVMNHPHSENVSAPEQPLPGPSGLHSVHTWEHGVQLPAEEFTPYRGMAVKGMCPRKTGRPTSDIWNHYKTEKSNGKNFVICIYCTTQKYGYPNATKMKIHTVKCNKCPENIRKQYKKELAQMVAKSEANKNIILKQGSGFESQGFS